MVASYTQFLAKRYKGQLDEKAKKYIAYVVDGAIRMQGLVNDLLTYSRVGTGGRPIEKGLPHEKEPEHVSGGHRVAPPGRRAAESEQDGRRPCPDEGRIAAARP